MEAVENILRAIAIPNISIIMPTDAPILNPFLAFADLILRHQKMTEIHYFRFLENLSIFGDILLHLVQLLPCAPCFQVPLCTSLPSLDYLRQQVFLTPYSNIWIFL